MVGTQLLRICGHIDEPCAEARELHPQTRQVSVYAMGVLARALALSVDAWTFNSYHIVKCVCFCDTGTVPFPASTSGCEGCEGRLHEHVAGVSLVRSQVLCKAFTSLLLRATCSSCEVGRSPNDFGHDVLLGGASWQTPFASATARISAASSDT